MMSPLLLLLCSAASVDLPPVPTGTSPEFKATVYKVESLLSQGKFEAATALANRLPKKKFTIQWDDAGVPEMNKELYKQSINAALAEWKRVIPDLDITVASKAEIKVSFQETLPPPSDSVMPAGAVFFTSDDPNEPRIETVIALKRETPPLGIDPVHVQNEVGFAIGSFLGLARWPKPVSYMGRYDSLLRLNLRGPVSNLPDCIAAIKLADTLRECAQKKVKVTVKKPQLYLTPTKLSHDPVSQGEQVLMSMEVTNRGNAPLELSTIVSCGCVNAVAPKKVDPGQTTLIQVYVDTLMVKGNLDKTFMLYSNDPDYPEQRVSVDFWVKPSQRLLKPSITGPVVMQKDGFKTDMFLVYDPAKPFKIKSMTLTGIKGTVDYSEWSGSLPDPEIKEESKERKGYKISVLVSPTERVGRVPMTLTIETDSESDRYIYDTTMLQWGIVAFPERVYFGEMKTTGAVGYFVVSRPGSPFKVTKVSTSDADRMKATAELQQNGEYRISVTVHGNLSPGNLSGNIIVETDDPAQPRLLVPINAVIK